MVAAKERGLPRREAHPKAHDIPARNIGSQESYLWQRAERKPDHGLGRQPARSGKRRVADQFLLSTGLPASQSGRLDM